MLYRTRFVCEEKVKRELPEFWNLLYGYPHMIHLFVLNSVILPRICGGVKPSSILFQKEGKDHAKGSKDLYTRV
jgi:hypothetical protein